MNFFFGGTMSTFIIKPDFFKENFENYIVLDCRAELADHDFGKREYSKEHIKGAFFVDGEKVLTGKISEHGGRHPMPEMEEFRKTMESFGISDSSKVAIYGLFGARAAFMLRLFGIEAGFISGDLDVLKKSGIPFDAETPELKKGSISGKIDDKLLVRMEKVRESINDPKVNIIDSRSPERYRGENEPIDPVAGHIPGAINFFWKDIIKENGTFLNESELKEHFSFDTEKETVLYCGSGVTACFNWLALKNIGVDCSIYAGSWSDWISFEENSDLISSGY